MAFRICKVTSFIYKSDLTNHGLRLPGVVQETDRWLCIGQQGLLKDAYGEDEVCEKQRMGRLKLWSDPESRKTSHTDFSDSQ